uniref:Peptidase C1A papain C-terminal domain-containing protein n=1 Tax=Megaselia scalaris TaxID=36166 RepID=T1GHQ4_MEGSC
MQEFVHPTSNEHDHQEHDFRKDVFRQNLRYIHSMNRKKLTYSLAVNHLADKTEEELRALRGYRSSNIQNNGGKPFPYDVEALKADLPDQFDWRIYGAVSQVKDQSVCGSCWSFGTIGAIEGAYFLKTGNLVRLSQQALIDCSWEFGNNGCDGGEDFRVYKWMQKVGGVPTEESYGPYLGQDGYCHIKNVSLVAPITGFVNVTTNNKDAFRVALFKNGPLSVAIDASPRSFSFYSHGVYYEPTCKNDVDGLDHAVLAVGYGTINGQDYWLVKNSWSNYWGNDGYILMSAKDNNCGVMTMPTYVTIISIIIVGLLCAIGQCTKPPKWDQTYTVRGTLYIPYAEISEPFYGWYDSHSKRSRIDYYGGMVKTYQLSNEGDFGISLKLAPIAMDSYTSTEVCLQVNGTKEDAIEIQSILPNTKDFTLETLKSLMANLYTLWVRYKPSPKYPSSRMPIPVRYEMKGYNTLLGSHYDHYYLDYDEYSHEDIDNEVFEIPEGTFEISL